MGWGCLRSRGRCFSAGGRSPSAGRGPAFLAPASPLSKGPALWSRPDGQIWRDQQVVTHSPPKCGAAVSPFLPPARLTYVRLCRLRPSCLFDPGESLSSPPLPFHFILLLFIVLWLPLLPSQAFLSLRLELTPFSPPLPHPRIICTGRGPNPAGLTLSARGGRQAGQRARTRERCHRVAVKGIASHLV